MNILLTGFGPFPGAPFNPTGRLVEKLARSRHLASSGVRRMAHVFRTSYEAVDHELPALLARTKPDVLVMFGLAGRTRHVRIETRARNAHQPCGSGCRGAQAARWYNRAGRAGDTGDARAGATSAQGGAIGGREGRPLARRRALSLQLSVLARDRGGARPERPEARRLRACAEGAVRHAAHGVHR